MSEAVIGWHTTVSGPEAQQATGTATIAGENGRTLMVDLLGTPLGWQTASAEVTVTGSSGTPLSLSIAQNRPDCVGRDDVWFDQELTTAQLAELGDAPYSFDVAVTIDGTVHHGTGTTEGNADGSATFDYTD